MFYQTLTLAFLVNVATAIYGGTKATLGQYPHHAVFWIFPEGDEVGEEFCGGIILDATHVLTAGHCAYGGFVGPNVDPANPGFMYMNVTTLNVRTGIDATVASVHKPTKVYVHPSFNPSNCAADRTDAAIYVIDPPFVFNENVKPIRLPTKAWLDLVGDAVGLADTFVSGFGLTDSCGDNDVTCAPTGSSNDLLSVKLVIEQPDKCLSPYKGSICALGGSKGICTGDSGSGFVVKQENEWTLIGLVTEGHKPAVVHLSSNGVCGQPGSQSQFTSYKFIRDDEFVANALAGTMKEGMPHPDQRTLCVEPTKPIVLGADVIVLIIVLVFLIIFGVIGCIWLASKKKDAASKKSPVENPLPLNDDTGIEATPI